LHPQTCVAARLRGAGNVSDVLFLIM